MAMTCDKNCYSQGVFYLHEVQVVAVDQENGGKVRVAYLGCLAEKDKRGVEESVASVV